MSDGDGTSAGSGRKTRQSQRDERDRLVSSIKMVLGRAPRRLTTLQTALNDLTNRPSRVKVSSCRGKLQELQRATEEAYDNGVRLVDYDANAGELAKKEVGDLQDALDGIECAILDVESDLESAGQAAAPLAAGAIAESKPRVSALLKPDVLAADADFDQFEAWKGKECNRCGKEGHFASRCDAEAAANAAEAALFGMEPAAPDLPFSAIL